MIDGLRPYPEYKDSGIPWVGRVPVGWEVQRLKDFASMQSGEGITSESVRVTAEFPVYGGNGRRGFTDRHTHDGTFVLIGRQGAHCGNVHLVFGRFWASEHAVVTSVRDGSDPRWLRYILLQMNLGQYSQAAAQPGLAVERIRVLRLPTPPLAEQHAIAHFLDHTDRRIQRYIQAKRRLIALLHEQRQAIIQRAVTRGVDPNVRLKDSGVPWIGHVPEHWEVTRCGRLFRERVQTGRADLPILSVSLRTGVTVRNPGNVGEKKQIMSDRSKYKVAIQGDVAYNMMRMWQGAVGVAPVDGLVSPAYVVAAPFQSTNTHFFSHLFRTKDFMHEANIASRGIVMDRNRLYWDSFKQIAVPTPPPVEQDAIVQSIHLRTSSLDRALTAAEREIALLREYRARLIADVVTGQLDVREAAARLPALPAEDAAPALDDTDDTDVDDADEEVAEA